MAGQYTPTSLTRLAALYVAVLLAVIAGLMFWPFPILLSGILHAWFGLFFLILASGIGAALGLIFGVKAIRGRAGTTVQGVLYGVIVGMVSGTLVGVVYGLGKPFAELGPLIGGTLGAVLGGVIGWETPRNSKVGNASLPMDGVHDRDLDG